MSDFKPHKKNPLAEVFGYPINNTTPEVTELRKKKLCPYNNKVAECTKDKAQEPLGVCSVYDDNGCPTITCPVRFREKWIIAEHAADFFFPNKSNWKILTEIRLKDKNGDSAGNIDAVIALTDQNNKVIDFGSLEVQGVYISGNVRNPFEDYIQKGMPDDFIWEGVNFPRADYLSSSRKRLAPQLLYKGGILKSWGKKQAVAIHKSFYATLPQLTQVKKSEADIAFFLYDQEYNTKLKKYDLKLHKSVFAKFEESMLKITKANAGSENDFKKHLEEKIVDGRSTLFE